MTTSVVDNGVNVEALLGAREAFADAPEVARFQWRSTRVLGQRHPQPLRRPDLLRVRRGADAQQDVRLRHRPPAAVRRPGQRDHADRVRVGRTGRLPDRGHRRRRPAAAASSYVRYGPRSPRRWTCRASSASTPTCATASAAYASTTAIDADATPAEIEALVAQSQKRSAVYDILTNPTAVTVTVTLTPMQHTTTVVVGAGHCGLAMSRCLAERSIDHVVLERGEVAHSWRTQRWDSLRLLTPNWMTRLPGYAYRGDDPDGYLAVPEVVRLLDDYAWRGGTGADRHHGHVGPAPRAGLPWCAPTGAPGTRGPSWSRPARPRCRLEPAVPRAPGDHLRDLPRTTATPAGYPTVACWSSAPRRAASRSPRSCAAVRAAGDAGRRRARADAAHLPGPRHPLVDGRVGRARRALGRDPGPGAGAQPAVDAAGRLARATLDLTALRRLGVRAGRAARGRPGRVGAVLRVAAQRVRAGRPQAGPAAGHPRRLGRPGRASTPSRRSGSRRPSCRTRPRCRRALGRRRDRDRSSGRPATARTCPSSTPACSTARAGVVHDGGVTAAPGLYLMGLPFLRRRKSTLIDGAGVGRPRAGRAPRRLPGHARPSAGELRGIVMEHHPVAAAVAAIVAGRDPQRLVAALTETVRLRALLPGGPIEAHGREDVAACFCALVRRLRHRAARGVRGRGRRRPAADPLPPARDPGGDPLGLHPDRGLQARRRAPGGDRPAVFRLPGGRDR